MFPVIIFITASITFFLRKQQCTSFQRLMPHYDREWATVCASKGLQSKHRTQAMVARERETEEAMWEGYMDNNKALYLP